MRLFAARLVVSLSVLAAALPAPAQGGHSLALKGGWGDPSPSVTDDIFTVEKTDGTGGFVGGIAWEGTFSKGWSLEGEVLYVRRTISADYSGAVVGGGVLTATWDTTTLEVPFHVKYALASGATRPYLLGGWVTAIALKIDQTGTSYVDTGTFDAKGDFTDVWLALEAGAGLEQKLGGKVGLELDVRYVYGLNDVRTVEGEGMKMRDLRVIAGLKIGL